MIIYTFNVKKNEQTWNIYPRRPSRQFLNRGWGKCPIGLGIYPEKDLAKSLFERAEDGFDATADVKFFENAVQVALDRLFANKKLPANFFVRAALQEDAQDILLPGR